MSFREYEPRRSLEVNRFGFDEHDVIPDLFAELFDGRVVKYPHIHASVLYDHLVTSSDDSNFDAVWRRHFGYLVFDIVDVFPGDYSNPSHYADEGRSIFEDDT